MGYRVSYVDNQDGNNTPPSIDKDSEGTTSWREAKKALRQWYLDKAKALRGVSEKDYFQA